MKKYLLIDSKYRNQNDPNNTSTNFRYYLPEPITIKKYIKIKLLYLPRANYLINQYNCRFRITFTTLNSNGSYNNDIQNFFIPWGNYTPLELVTNINNQYTGNGFAATYNTTSYKISFICAISFTLDLTMSNFYKLISLQSQMYASILQSSIYVFSTGVINFNNPVYLNLSINNITFDSVIGCNNQNNFGFIIPMNSTNFGDIINMTKECIKLKVNDFKTNYLDFAIYDDYNVLYDNNNIDWYTILEFET